jgi:hypothetical protein
MKVRGWAHADLVRITGQSSSVISQWLGRGSKEIKSIGSIPAVLRLSEASGYSAEWLAVGTGPKIAPRPPPPPTRNFQGDHEPTPSEWQFLQDLRVLEDEDRKARLEAIHSEAEKMRRYVAEQLGKYK